MSNIQYLTIENCKSQNEIQIFEIMEFYTGIYTSDPAYLSADVKEFANNTRNEAAEILRSRLQGYPLALLQAEFLSKFNQWYYIGKARYATDFSYFLAHNIKNWYNPDTKQTHFYSGIAQNVEFCSEIGELSTERINEVCKEIHADLLAAKFGNGKFVQA